jgi:hypothetical protein
MQTQSGYYEGMEERNSVQSSNGLPRVTPLPAGWNMEDPIGDELSGRQRKPAPAPSLKTPEKSISIKAASTGNAEEIIVKNIKINLEINLKVNVI